MARPLNSVAGWQEYASVTPVRRDSSTGWHVFHSIWKENSGGGEGGIRTHGGLPLDGFQDRSNRPLWHLPERPSFYHQHGTTSGWTDLHEFFDAARTFW